MPSRIRLVLKGPGDISYIGDEARNTLAAFAIKELAWGKEMPDNWKSLKRIDRIRYMKKFIPPDWVMEVYMEPKGTRPTKSAFKAASSKGPQLPGVDVEAEVRHQQRGYRDYIVNRPRDVQAQVPRPGPVGPAPAQINQRARDEAFLHGLYEQQLNAGGRR